eukprot:TRINITY_DN4734_c0_g1_i2.p1 TRINITY_DN4734_c0_g1~~TRINITY_DN4734_c0_g1_i2.p1  ORF type:complete len:312 (-),score=86.81 TRINITY_DN4734_c0_g1_i2:103-1038(-)
MAAAELSSSSPHRRMPRGSKAGKYMQWVLTPETKLRKSLSGLASTFKAALPQHDEQHALADIIFDALDGPPPGVEPTLEPTAIEPQQVATNTAELMPGQLRVDVLEPPHPDMSAAQLTVLYTELQRRFVEQHVTTERTCHEVYQSALHHRQIAEHRAREAGDRLTQLRLRCHKSEAQVAHLQSELQSALAQKELIRVQRAGVIAAQAQEIRELQDELHQLQHQGLAPTVDLTLQHSQAMQYQSRIHELEQLHNQSTHRIAELEGEARSREEEWYRMIISYQQLQEQATITCLLYTSPSPRDRTRSRMPSSA